MVFPWQTLDSFGWRKYFLYDSPVLGGSPNEIDYLWKGTQASFMRTTLTHDTARRMTSYKNEMFKRRDFFTYDSNGLLQKSRYEGWPGWPYFTETGSLYFSRDTSGLISGITGDKELNANYDQDLQITSINHILPQPFAEGYTYDDNGNRLTSLTNSFIYDDLNRLTESTLHDYTYDADGNMTQEKNKLTTESKKYYYDSENRMIKYEHQASDVSPIDITATYKYDIFGRRLQKNVNGAITNFFWENDTMTYELNDQYQPIRKYLTGSGGIDDYEGHLEYSEITDFPHIFFPEYRQPWYSYMKDQVGTIYKVHSMKTRAIAESRVYDSFGNLVNQTGTATTPLGFQGKYYDAESGLNYFYQRYYNPMIGRFTSEDPIRLSGGLNLNSFVENNPVNFSDPSGTRLVLPNGMFSDYKKIDEIFFSTPYTKCFSRCMFGNIGAPGVAHGMWEALNLIIEVGGGTWSSRIWYTLKYPNWFVAWGKYSTVLVPQLTEKITMAASKISIIAWLYFYYEMGKCVKDCMECTKSH